MKYALLDTDFISKTHTVRLDDNRHLIDLVLTMPDYSFYCHEQTVKELSRHNAHAPAWLGERIEEDRIIEYSDEKIITDMSAVYRNLSIPKYIEMLKSACDAFDADCYAELYGELQATVSKDAFIIQLQSIESTIGEGRNLGEIKSYVLLQWLSILFGDQLYYFCSDDKDARNGILGIENINVRCITLVSSLLRIFRETKCSPDEMEPYIQAMLGYFAAHNRKTIRVVESSKVGRFEKVDCSKVLRGIFEDRFVELPNGFLKYK